MLKLRISLLTAYQVRSGLNGTPTQPNGASSAILSRKILILADPDNSLLNLYGAIIDKHLKLYPEDKPIVIEKLQDESGCDLDPDYRVGDVFSDNSSVLAILTHPIVASFSPPASQASPSPEATSLTPAKRKATDSSANGRQKSRRHSSIWITRASQDPAFSPSSASRLSSLSSSLNARPTLQPPASDAMEPLHVPKKRATPVKRASAAEAPTKASPLNLEASVDSGNRTVSVELPPPKTSRVFSGDPEKSPTSLAADKAGKADKIDKVEDVAVESPRPLTQRQKAAQEARAQKAKEREELKLRRKAEHEAVQQRRKEERERARQRKRDEAKAKAKPTQENKSEQKAQDESEQKVNESSKSQENPKENDETLEKNKENGHAGKTQNGKAQNGKTENGKAQNGKTENGTTHNEQAQNGQSLVQAETTVQSSTKPRVSTSTTLHRIDLAPTSQNPLGEAVKKAAQIFESSTEPKVSEVVDADDNDSDDDDSDLERPRVAVRSPILDVPTEISNDVQVVATQTQDEDEVEGALQPVPEPVLSQRALASPQIETRSLRSKRDTTPKPSPKLPQASPKMSQTSPKQSQTSPRQSQTSPRPSQANRLPRLSSLDSQSMKVHESKDGGVARASQTVASAHDYDDDDDDDEDDDEDEDDGSESSDDSSESEDEGIPLSKRAAKKSVRKGFSSGFQGLLRDVTGAFLPSSK